MSRQNRKNIDMDNGSYTEAKKELTAIVTAIETGELDVDALTEKVKRASELILFCREKLTHTDHELQKILDDIV